MSKFFTQAHKRPLRQSICILIVAAMLVGLLPTGVFAAVYDAEYGPAYNAEYIIYEYEPEEAEKTEEGYSEEEAYDAYEPEEPEEADETCETDEYPYINNADDYNVDDDVGDCEEECDCIYNNDCDCGYEDDCECKNDQIPPAPVIAAFQGISMFSCGPAVATGSLGGPSPAPWDLCGCGVVTIGAGTIYMPNVTAILNQSRFPLELRPLIQRIVFTEPVTAGPSLYDLFHGLHNLTAIDNISFLDTSATANMGRMFMDTFSLDSVDLSHFDTSNVTHMYRMFMDTGLVTLNLGGSFNNPSSVVNMGSMFWGAGSLTTIGDVSHWDTSSTVRMSRMFDQAQSITGLNPSSWDTSSVTLMYRMFANASSLTSLDLSSWNVSNVTRMENMFAGASSLAHLDVSGWNTGNVTNMNSIFNGAGSLTRLDLGSWVTNAPVNMNVMFTGANALREVIIGPGWTTFNSPNLRNAPNDAIYTGHWRNVGDGTVINPLGAYSLTAAQLLNNDIRPPGLHTWVWEPRMPQHLVNFVSGGNGTVSPSSTLVAVAAPPLTIGTALAITTTPAANHEFSHWTSSRHPGVFTTDEIRDLPISNNTTFTAIFTLVQRTVTFDLNGGDDNPANFPPQTVTLGQTASPPAQEPTRGDYSFNGWTMYDGMPFDFDTPITDDITLYAQWIKPIEWPIFNQVFTVTFQTLGGTGNFPVQEVPAGGLAARPMNEPTLDGHIFVDWYTHFADGTPFDFSTPITANIVLYARWYPPLYQGIINVIDEYGVQIPDASVQFDGDTISRIYGYWLITSPTMFVGEVNAYAYGFIPNSEVIAPSSFTPSRIAIVEIVLEREDECDDDECDEDENDSDENDNDEPDNNEPNDTYIYQPTGQAPPLQFRPRPLPIMPIPEEAAPYEERFRRHFVNGYPDGSFQPDGHLTRAEMFHVFFNISRPSGFRPSTATRFPDVGTDAWYFNAISYLEGRGLIQGHPDGTLRPHDPITNAEFAALAVTFFGLANYIAPDNLVAADSHWSANYINLGFAHGWFEYFGNIATFVPDAPIPRAQAVALLNFYQGREPCVRAINMYLAETSRIIFPDLERGHWSFYEVMEAAFSRYYVVSAAGYETWIVVTN